ncbi:nucleotide exchange factor GrpE [Sphingomonas montanisoli]|uniref:Protein GrpE n=1 Tax=Sphingomonas montanisoli TaxID=2606412 RepID=A0A5D9CB62_9SPHN|nr:nucleotide exchange factor GrpE [Sphingomonas montanisoli]TZG29198.1 nucleotide exchange factor GrpE [Sphingomonas montanisoli]
MNEEPINENDIETPEVEQAEAPPESPVAALESEIVRLKQDVLYARAETENVRRRGEKEKADTAAYAVTKFARDILSVADNLSRAIIAIPAELREDERVKSLIAGIEMTGKELDNIFQRNDISKIEAMGEKLDPNKHQAMIELPSDAEPGTVVQEMQSGYMIKDRLLRPALVAVAKAAE